jgi:hypothetical protein
MISGINHKCRSETKKQDVKLGKFILKKMLSQKKTYEKKPKPKNFV